MRSLLLMHLKTFIKISNLHFLVNRMVLLLWLPAMYIVIYNRRQSQHKLSFYAFINAQITITCISTLLKEKITFKVWRLIFALRENWWMKRLWYWIFYVRPWRPYFRWPRVWSLFSSGDPALKNFVWFNIYYTSVSYNKFFKFSLTWNCW